MDGWEATQLIKANPATATIPVIALTAHALASDRAKSVEVGCSDFDTKPVDLQRLLGKIRRFSRRSINRTLPSLEASSSRAGGATNSSTSRRPDCPN